MDVDALALQLKSLRTHEEVRRFRQRLDPATAKAVIMHPSFSALERGCLSLVLNLGAPSARGHHQGIISETFACEQLPCSQQPECDDDRPAP
jgi:hypothetical protein